MAALVAEVQVGAGDVSFVNEHFKTRLEKRIVELEKESTVEFVPALVPRASRYAGFRALFALIATLLLISPWLSKSSLAHRMNYDLLVGGFVLLIFSISGHPRILARLLPAKVKQKALMKRAHEIFLREKIFSTRERTGVLILVSRFERAVFILADQGLLQKVKEEEWSALAVTLAEDFNHKDPGENFFAALDKLSQRLKVDFPPRPDDTDELSNKLR